MNLHKLPGISRNTGAAEAVRKGLANGMDALFPVPPELAEDIFDVVIIDQGIKRHDLFEMFFSFRLIRICGSTCRKYLLLGAEGDLGIRDYNRRKGGICFSTFLAESSLNIKADQIGIVFYISLITPIENQTAFFYRCIPWYAAVEMPRDHHKFFEKNDCSFQ